MTSEKETFMGKMMGSLLQETIKRMAEDVWEKKFSSLNEKISGYRGGYGDPVKEQVLEAMKDILKDIINSDDEVRSKIHKALLDEINNALGPST